jgi:hypothetical protein
MRSLAWVAVILASCTFDTSGLSVPDRHSDIGIDLSDTAVEARPGDSIPKPLDSLTSDVPPSEVAPDVQAPDVQAADVQAADVLSPDTAPPWDVSAVFYQTDFNFYPVEIFGQAVNDNQMIYASFDGTSDSTYSRPLHDCPPYYYNTPKARTWDIERKRDSAQKYRILIRGRSDSDCGQGTPHCEGTVQLHAASAWSITQNVKCSANVSCNVDMVQGTISWHSGQACPSCCACPDGAAVDIEVVVTRP